MGSGNLSVDVLPWFVAERTKPPQNTAVFVSFVGCLNAKQPLAQQPIVQSKSKNGLKPT
jgi:hypothetical protein